MKNAVIVAVICVLFCSSLPARQATRIELTDKVLVEDTVRFGINLGSDSYYSGAVPVKKRSQQNFEGTSYRQCHFDPSRDTLNNFGPGYEMILPPHSVTVLEWEVR